MNKQMGAFVCCVLIGIRATECAITKKNVAIAAAITGGTIVGIIALAELYKWLSKESDTQLLNNTKKVLHELEDMYAAMVQTVEGPYHVGTLLVAADRTIILNTINETILYDLALKAWNMQKHMEYYYNNLRDLLSILHVRKERLIIRINDLSEADNAYVDYVAYSLVQEMDALVKKLKKILPHFELLRDYLNKHSTYFVLFELEDVLRNRYQDELRVLTDYPNNNDYIKQEIKRCIYANFQASSYPHVRYVEALDADMQQLTRSIRQARYAYTDRIRWSQWVVDSLQYIKSIVTADPQYTQEIRERERELMDHSYA